MNTRTFQCVTNSNLLSKKHRNKHFVPFFWISQKVRNFLRIPLFFLTLFHLQSWYKNKSHSIRRRRKSSIIWLKKFFFSIFLLKWNTGQYFVPLFLHRMLCHKVLLDTKSCLCQSINNVNFFNLKKHLRSIDN
jgi:hypothetical protein